MHQNQTQTQDDEKKEKEHYIKHEHKIIKTKKRSIRLLHEENIMTTKNVTLPSS